MYNIISIILLIASLNCISQGKEWFAILLAGSVGFAIAGAIGSVKSAIDDIFIRGKIEKKDLLDGGTEIKICKTPYQSQNINK